MAQATPIKDFLSSFMLGELFKGITGVEMQHIPYKGNADGMQALLGNHVMAHSDATRDITAAPSS